MTWDSARIPCVDIDLSRLREMHPRLPIDLALHMIGQAALALQRNAHVPGVRVSLDLERVLSSGALRWPPADMNDLAQHDYHRITELGAETVALAVAYRHRSWRVLRRVQRTGRADWLLEDSSGDTPTIVALEVSGIDRGPISSRISDKLKQVGLNADVEQRWASVVGFEEPVAALHTVNG